MTAWVTAPPWRTPRNRVAKSKTLFINPWIASIWIGPDECYLAPFDTHAEAIAYAHKLAQERNTN